MSKQEIISNEALYVKARKMVFLEQGILNEVLLLEALIRKLGKQHFLNEALLLLLLSQARS